MPTPVSTARQCLTDDAARALEDAVAVARRRCHGQTTSLHAVSALLALPSSALRDACLRALTGGGSIRLSSSSTTSPSYSPRLQFRALELSVGVSLDRLPSSKATTEEEPPVSNSLMAAIKRSQANQRRHPDSFHLFHQNQNPQVHGTTSFLKVELKHFVLSILDDPIVSRVFAEAGFRSCDVKLALLQPPLTPPSLQSSSRFFSRTRSPPLFLCNLEPGRTVFPFPDENSRRISEILARKNKRNPLLMGVYAKSALKSFTELVKNGRGGSLFTAEISGLSVSSLENEITEFVNEGGSSEEKMSVRFRELGREVEECSGSGVVVSFGEVEVLVREGMNVDAVRFVVSGLTRLLEIHQEKVWLVGVAQTSDAYSKFLALFPTVENDWDLHLLTVTSATPSMEGLFSKSSLMGSFVPFGGFFSTPEIKSPVSCTNASFTRCDKCNEKYEQEVTDILKTNEENPSLKDKILGFQKKWNDICQRLHQSRSLPEYDISQTRTQAPPLDVFRFGSGFKESSSKDPSHSEFQYSSQVSFMPKEVHSIFPSKQSSPVPPDTISVSAGTDHVSKLSERLQINVQTPLVAPSPMAKMSVLDHRSSSSLTPVTTDLGLGTLYAYTAQEPDTPKLQDKKKHLQLLSDSVSTDCDAMNESTSQQIARSSCFVPNVEGKFDSVDFKFLNQILTLKVGWQDQAIAAIIQTLSLCKSGAGKRRGSHGRADIWFAFLGPDRLGKKKIASVLAETIFGNTESLICVDLGYQDSLYPSNLIFECQNSHCYDVLRRKTVVDYIAGELSKKPHSIVFLENVDKADFLVQSSLLQAIRTGKFPDSRGRAISINSTIFLVTSTVCKGNGSSSLEESKMFSEERIREAKKCQIQLLLEHSSKDAKRTSSANVKVVPRKVLSNLNKRKLDDSSDSKEGATCKMQKQVSEASSRSYLDLNMPLEEGEEGINDHNHERESQVENSDSWLSDFCGQVDEKVVFKPFNFDVLAEQILKSISIQFQRTFGSEFELEIDYEVMTQILAATWSSDNKYAVEDWVEHVLGSDFAKAHQRYKPTAPCVVKLVNCESIFVEEQAPGVCLPARINLN